MKVWLSLVALAGCVGSGVVMAQTSVAVTTAAAPLLPDSFGEWKHADVTVPVVSSYSLANANKDALEEAGPQRSQVADYVRGASHLHVEAIQFADRTGAYSAFTLVERPGMQPLKDFGVAGAEASAGDGALLFTVGPSLVLASPATAADITALKPLVESMPKVMGSKGVAPLLPTLIPAKGLVEGSERYALGAASYSAEGGVLPAQSLEWDKSAEAVTAQYADKRGKETLTLLLYPTPTIAGAMAKKIQNEVAGMGAGFASAKVRREGELVMLVEGSFSADEAQKMVENIHFKQELSVDRDMEPTVHTKVMQTFSLLQSIAILSGVLMLAAVVLGLFLGFGRAAVRVLQGKPAALEPEFLSLHLEPQNEAPRFESAGR